MYSFSSAATGLNDVDFVFSLCLRGRRDSCIALVPAPQIHGKRG
jgi:hypothetical protein